jgi:hypothetical protein
VPRYRRYFKAAAGHSVLCRIAKLNSDWLAAALPLKIWLPANAHLPVIGQFLGKEWVAYAFSWIWAVYDLSIPFFCFTGAHACLPLLLVVVFMLTRILFPIGIFPYVMIVSTLIFFSSGFHRKVLEYITSRVKVKGLKSKAGR